MFLIIILLLLSFYLLSLSSDIIVNSSEKIADIFAIDKLIVGIVVLSIGTSLPELAVTIFSSLENQPDIILGNVVGSNIANSLLIIPIICLLFSISPKLKRLDILISLTSVIVLTILLLDYTLTRFDGIILLSIPFIYLYFIYKQNKKYKSIKEIKKGDFEIMIFFKMIFGFVLLSFASKLLIDKVQELGELINLNTLTISTVIVAFGTSVPELAVSISAAKKKQYDFIWGNIIGSNIFNIVIVLAMGSIFSNISILESYLNYEYIIFVLANISLFLISSKFLKYKKLILLFYLFTYLWFVFF